MTRKFITTIVAAAIAVTGFTATPAAAGNDNFEKLMLGAGTLLIIGSALEHHNSGTKVIIQDDYAHGYGHDRTPHKKKKKKRRFSKALPGYCLKHFETRRGHVRMFGARCLKRNYRFAHKLPEHCKIKIKTWRHGERVKRVGYQARCLRHKGYYIAGRR